MVQTSRIRSVIRWIKTPFAVTILGGLVVAIIWQLCWTEPDKRKDLRAKLRAADAQLARGDTTDALHAYDVVLQMPEAEAERAGIELQQGRCYVRDADDGRDPIGNLRKAVMYFERAREHISKAPLTEVATIERELIETYLRLASWRETSTYIARARPVLARLTERNLVLRDAQLALAIDIATTDLSLQHALTIRGDHPADASRLVSDAIRLAKTALRTTAAAMDRLAQARLHTLLSFGHRQLSEIQRSNRRSTCEDALGHAREAQKVANPEANPIVSAVAQRAEGAAYYCLATVINPQGNLYEAIPLYLDSSRSFEQAHRPEEVAKTQHNLAAAYARLAEFDRPEENLFAASEYAAKAATFFTWDYSALASSAALNRAMIALAHAEHFDTPKDAEIAAAELRRIERGESDAGKRALGALLRGAARLRLGAMRHDRREIVTAIDELQQRIPSRGHPHHPLIRTTVGEAYLALSQIENEQINLVFAIMQLTEALHSQVAAERPYTFCNTATLLAYATARHAVLTNDVAEHERAIEFAKAALIVAHQYGFVSVRSRMDRLLSSVLLSRVGP